MLSVQIRKPILFPILKSDIVKQIKKKGNEVMNLKLSAPKEVTFWIAVILAVLGVLANQGIIGGLAGYSFWLVVIGFIVLALGNLMKGV